jgi:hypothetical protein
MCVRHFSLLLNAQTGSADHPVTYSVRIKGSFFGIKRLERRTDHSPPSITEFTSDWASNPTPIYVFMVCA